MYSFLTNNLHGRFINFLLRICEMTILNIHKSNQKCFPVTLQSKAKQNSNISKIGMRLKIAKKKITGI